MAKTPEEKRSAQVNKWHKKFLAASIGKIFNGTRRPVKNLEFGIAVNYQKLVRLRAMDANGFVQCVSCGRSYRWQEMNGGHFIGRSNYRTIVDFGDMFPERLIPNCWGQCPRCNDHLSGNHASFREFLVAAFGDEKVKELEAAKLPDGWVWDKRKLAELKVDFLEEIKQLEKG